VTRSIHARAARERFHRVTASDGSQDMVVSSSRGHTSSAMTWLGLLDLGVSSASLQEIHGMIAKLSLTASA